MSVKIFLTLLLCKLLFKVTFYCQGFKWIFPNTSKSIIHVLVVFVACQSTNCCCCHWTKITAAIWWGDFSATNSSLFGLITYSKNLVGEYFYTKSFNWTIFEWDILIIFDKMAICTIQWKFYFVICWNSKKHLLYSNKSQSLKVSEKLKQ